MTKHPIEVITSVERRRRWSPEDKERLVSACFEPGAVISEIARAAGTICEALLIEATSEQALEVGRQLLEDCTGQEPVEAIVERYLSTRVRT